MKIEIGKKYKTRGGWMAEVVRTAEIFEDYSGFDVDHGREKGIWLHKHNGERLCFSELFDLIAPWEDETSEQEEAIMTAAAYDQHKAAIRRQYACAALTGLLAQTDSGRWSPDRYAMDAMAFADAMMKAEEE